MSRRGFTLIEMLVVIGIIALLLSILAPPLSAARHHAKTVVCAANLRQITSGLTTYALDNRNYPPGFDDTFPLNSVSPPGGYPGNPTFDKRGWWWFHFAGKYLGGEDFIATLGRCPSRRIKSFDLDENVLCGNYGVNQFICKTARLSASRKEFTGKPLQENQIKSASETLLLVDCGYSLVNWWHMTETPPGPLATNTHEDTAYIPGMQINAVKHIWPGEEQDALEGRHQNARVNVGFADGHVACEKADNLLVEKSTGQEYKNLIPLWKPR
jgi:prepilin-type N-terminal cleavage/methylation domain-containing protein/prepilin-type processing-associated H-X9-DG protein